MASSEKIIKNTTYLTIAFVGQKLLAFIYFIIIARLIGVENVGNYTVALSFTTIFAIFIDFGTSPIITREIAKHKENMQLYFSNIIFSKLFLSLLVYLIVIISINTFDYSSLTRQLVYVSGFVMIIDSFVLTAYSLLRGLHTLKYEAIGIIINQSIVMSIGVIGLLFITTNPIIIIIAFLFGSISNLVWSLYNLKYKFGISLRLKWDAITLKYIYFISIPFALAGIFGRVYSYVDAIILERFIGNAAVGFYTVAYKIPFALQFVPSAFAAAIYPAMSSYFKNSPEKLSEIWKKATIYLMLLAIPITAGIYALSEIIILKFYGEQYIVSIPVLKTLIFGVFFIFINFPLGSLLSACNRQATNTTLIGFTMIINVIANIFLIQEFGIIGAAYAFLISHGFLFVSTFIIAHKIIKIPHKELAVKLVSILLSSILMLFIVNIIKEFSWILSIPVGALVYLLSILLLKVISKDEVALILRKLKKI